MFGFKKVKKYDHQPATCECKPCIDVRTEWAREQLVKLAVDEVFRYYPLTLPWKDESHGISNG